jgi:hypothetical protein
VGASGLEQCVLEEVMTLTPELKQAIDRAGDVPVRVEEAW